MRSRLDSHSLSRRKILILLAIIIGALSFGCAQSGARRTPGGRLRVVATTGMIGDAAARVGGNRVEVINLMGVGVDPHLYRASEGDVRRLAEADVIFYNGLHLEAGMGEVLERMGGRTRTAAIGEAIERERLLAPPEFRGAFDPHVWFDVTMWMRAVERVRDVLIEVDGANADEYRTNTENYMRELQELHEYVLAQAERVPREQRVLVTAHDAFNYFGRAYNFEVRGLQGISTAAEASTADVQELSRFIADRRIPAVFVETSIPQRTIEAVQAAVRSHGFETRIGGQLFSDAMGNPGTPEGNYVGMVRHNIDTIVGALTAR